MGFSILAVLEYDESTSSGRPFSTLPSGTIPLHKFYALRGSKDELFVRACMGRTWDQKSSNRRGLPANISTATWEAFSLVDDPAQATWLSYGELSQYMEASSIAFEDLELSSRIVLRMMKFLVEHLGDENVRLIICLD